MFRKIFVWLFSSFVLLSVPALTAAHPAEERHPGEGHRFEHHHHPQADWSAYPAEIQAYKNQLDQLLEQQRGLFEQFKQQREEIRNLHQKLSGQRRQAVKEKVKNLIVELQSTRNSIHTMRDQKIAAWEKFREHSLTKQWDAAKIDMQTVIARKQEIVAKQRTILETQQRILERMKK